MKEDILHIIGFAQEPERADIQADKLISLFKSEMVVMLDFCKTYKKMQTNDVSDAIVDWYFKQLTNL